MAVIFITFFVCLLLLVFVLEDLFAFHFTLKKHKHTTNEMKKEGKKFFLNSNRRTNAELFNLLVIFGFRVIFYCCRALLSQLRFSKESLCFILNLKFISIIWNLNKCAFCLEFHVIYLIHFSQYFFLNDIQELLKELKAL